MDSRFWQFVCPVTFSALLPAVSAGQGSDVWGWRTAYGPPGPQPAAQRPK